MRIVSVMSDRLRDRLRRPPSRGLYGARCCWHPADIARCRWRESSSSTTKKPALAGFSGSGRYWARTS